MEIKEKVYAAMQKANKPLRMGEIAELSGVDKKEVEKAIKQLSKEGKAFSPERCCWQAKF
jgi:transcription initiation factor TFIIIB Brf1 subunit/transcription initiation factor TFIIB